MTARRALLALLLVAWAGMAVSMACRLRYGVDVTDEAFYSAVPYEFSANGFHDARSLWGPLLAPLVRDAEGIILFVRRCWLALALLTGLTIFATARRFVPPESALVAGMVPLAFAPMWIPSLSYNTIGMLLLAAGLFCGAASTAGERGAALLAGASVGSLAAASFVYPPLVVPALLSCTITGIQQARRRRWSAVVTLFAAGLACVAAVGAYVRALGTGALRETLALHHALNAALPEKLSALPHKLLDEAPYRGREIVVMALLATASLVLRGKARHAAVAALLLLLTLFSRDTIVSPGLAIVCATIFLSVPALRAAKHPLIAMVWLPSLLAGIITAASSNVGPTNAAVGALAAFIAAIALLSSGANAAAALALLLSLHASAWQFVYRDDPIRFLTARVPDGPYRGMITSETRLRFLQSMQSDVKHYDVKGGSVLFYDDFPAGYLMTRMRPAAPTVWLVSPAYRAFDRNAYRSYYASQAHDPDVVFELRANDVAGGDPVRNFFAASARFRVAADRREWTVYRRASAP